MYLRFRELYKWFDTCLNEIHWNMINVLKNHQICTWKMHLYVSSNMTLTNFISSHIVMLQFQKYRPTSQVRRIVLLTDMKSKAGTVMYKSFSSWLVSNSVISAEIIIFANKSDVLLLIHQQQESFLKNPILAHILTYPKVFSISYQKEAVPVREGLCWMYICS